MFGPALPALLPILRPVRPTARTSRVKCAVSLIKMIEGRIWPWLAGLGGGREAEIKDGSRHGTLEGGEKLFDYERPDRRRWLLDTVQKRGEGRMGWTQPPFSTQHFEVTYLPIHHFGKLQQDTLRR